MKKQILTDLTAEKLKALFKANKHLQEEVQERMLEDSYYWIENYLYSFKDVNGLDYSISCYNDYFDLKNTYSIPDFFEAAEKMQTDFCILEPETNTLLIRAKEKIRFFIDCYEGYEDISNKRYENLEKWILEVVDKIKSEILKSCQDEILFCYSLENQENYFLDCFDSFDYQVEENKLYKLVCYA